MPGEPGVDEPGRGVGQQAQAAQRGLALHAGRDVVGTRHLGRWTRARTAGCRMNGSSPSGSTSRVRSLVRRGVDVRVAVVLEHPEEPVQRARPPTTAAASRVPRVERDPAGHDLRGDVAVREQQRSTSGRTHTTEPLRAIWTWWNGPGWDDRAVEFSRQVRRAAPLTGLLAVASVALVNLALLGYLAAVVNPAIAKVATGARAGSAPAHGHDRPGDRAARLPDHRDRAMLDVYFLARQELAGRLADARDAFDDEPELPALLDEQERRIERWTTESAQPAMARGEPSAAAPSTPSVGSRAPTARRTLFDDYATPTRRSRTRPTLAAPASTGTARASSRSPWSRRCCCSSAACC